jgi:tetratricopeptide (TPR) repeat protein
MTSASVDGAKRPALVLRYQSDEPRSRLEEIANEADDIWDGLRLDAEKGKFNRVIITAFFKPEHQATGKPFVTFEMQLDASNKWHCINDQRVGGGSPAKTAYYEGVQLAKQREYAEALVCYDKAISLDPKFSPAYSDRAGMRIIFGHPEKSLSDCDEAISLNPENAMAYANRGFAHTKLGQFEKAIEDFTNALKFNYITPDVLKMRGVALAKLGKYDLAIIDFSKAIKLQPNDPQLYLNRATALAKLAQIDKETAEKLAAGRIAAKSAPNSNNSVNLSNPSNGTTAPIGSPVKLETKRQVKQQQVGQ